MLTATTATKTKAGVGFSQKEDSFQAGVEIANMALSKNELANETLFFLFATAQHKIDDLINGVRSVVGKAPQFLGCSSTGLVTKDFISYSGVLAGGGFITSGTPFFNLFFEESVKNREYEAGKAIAKKIQDGSTLGDAAVVLFYDSVKQTTSEGQPMLNLATPILEGFYSQYGYWPSTFAGIGAFGDINFTYPCSVWVNEQSGRHALGAAVILGSLQMNTIIMRGTRPIGGYHKITKADGNVIYELDNKPALDVVYGMLGTSVAWEDFPFLVTMGVNNGDKYGPYDEDNYFSRLCFSIDKDQKSLTMFETDMVEGIEVQLMRRDIDFNYIQPRINKLMEQIGARKPVFALYIDCVGRVCGFSGMAEEESLEVARALGDIPFFGIFSGVEIANVGKDVKALDWTGVLCLFTET